MGVWSRRIGTGVLGGVIAVSALVLAAPANACACGAFLLPEDSDVVVGEESAIISWDGESERIILSLDVESEGSDAALLIPTPSPATVEITGSQPFSELAEATAPRVEEVDLWWPEWLMREDLSNDDIVPGPGPAPTEAPLEGIEVEVLDAGDADRLEGWLKKNDYVMRDEVASGLAPYIQQGWHLALIRLDAETLDGRLQALDIRFETNQVVYPMRLSVAAGGSVMVRTYVFAEHRMERTDSMGGHLTWARPVAQTDFVHQTLVDIAADHGFLTVWEQYFSDPRNQIDGDMVFAAASTDTPYEQVYTEVVRHELFGAPAGPTLVFAGLIILGFGGGLYSMVRRRRRIRARVPG